MSILAQTKNICRRLNISPARSRGQNFLIEDDIYRRITDLADIGKNDIVLEVGPGLGFLTERLIGQAKRVVAVEIDNKLYAYLKDKFANEPGLLLLKDNILDIKTKQFGADYKIVANLPYNITSVFLRKFLTADNPPCDMTLMLQKEVAERITAKPGKMSLLALSVQFYARAETGFKVGPACFWPQPEVDSAVVKIYTGKRENGEVEEKKLFQLARIGFSSKRKMLKNNLSCGLRVSPEEVENKLTLAGFDPKVRAQDLSVNDWRRLTRIFT